MTKIEWTHRPNTKGESWNLISGCTKVSPGCDSCYALSMSWRLQNMEKRPKRYEEVVESTICFDPPVLYHEKQGRIKWTGRVNLDYDALEKPYRWKKPRTVFVASMADLFHEKVPDKFLSRAFQVMFECEQHTFLVLTKRAKRMHEFVMDAWGELAVHAPKQWTPPNIWLMVTAENQEQADKRIPYLLQTPAAVRGVSVEPMLSAINLEGPGYVVSSRVHDVAAAIGHVVIPHPLDWVVIGAESGPNRRPMRLKWAMDLIDQCADAQVPVFCKQITQPDMSVSKDPSEWPTELRRREWPR